MAWAPAGALALLLLAPPWSAEALTISYESQFGRVQASAKSLTDTETSNTVGTFDEMATAFSGGAPAATATADQQSQLLVEGIFAEGSVNAGVAGGNPASGSTEASGLSRLDVTFALSESTPFSLTGALSEALTGAGVAPNLEATVTLTSLDTGAPIVDADSESTSIISATGILAPGRYRLEARALSTVRGSSITPGSTFGDATFSFSLVPEPSTALLFAFGLVTLAGRRRRLH